MERQRREEWERAKREELARRRAGEQEEISRLKAKKRSLELELEAVVSSRCRPNKTKENCHQLLITVDLRLLQGNKHKQISDRLRDAQSKRWILKAEVELVNQKRDDRIAEIGALQLQFEVRPQR